MDEFFDRQTDDMLTGGQINILALYLLGIGIAINDAVAFLKFNTNECACELRDRLDQEAGMRQCSMCDTWCWRSHLTHGRCAECEKDLQHSGI